MDQVAKHMLTTADNPYDPFTQWDEWYLYDEASGHHTCGLLARIVRGSEDLSEPDQELANETAINEIIKEDPLGIYLKVSESSVIIPTDLEN